MEIGVYTFAELRPDPASGATVSAEQRLRDLLEEIELADQVGLDVFGVGEHHRPDFAVSAPAVVLARRRRADEADPADQRGHACSAPTTPCASSRNSRRVDLLSGGRAEIMAGRGSFIESFPLFGYDLSDYDELFAEKLELLLRLREAERVTWSGTHRARRRPASTRARPGRRYPCGSPSAARRSRRSAPGRSACRWRSRSSAASPSGSCRSSRCTARRRGRGARPAYLPVSINSHAYVAETSQQAADEFYPAYAAMMNAIGKERGWPPMHASRTSTRCERCAARSSSAAPKR